MEEFGSTKKKIDVQTIGSEFDSAMQRKILCRRRIFDLKVLITDFKEF